MRNEYYLSRAQLKGYLFELVILELLRKNNFVEINCWHEDKNRVRNNRDGFVEFRGKGTWHQIDCPCDYSCTIPFSYPLRLLGEAKFYKNPLDKKYIREYIGVIKDIQENYFVPVNSRYNDVPPRKMEIGVYFSANGFQEEAEKLAYAHGIKTISYENNVIIKRIKDLIDEFVENYISVRILRDGEWYKFKNYFVNVMRNGYFTIYENHDNDFSKYVANGFENIISDIYHSLVLIRSSFFATTATDVFIHFISDSEFPAEIFNNNDRGLCRVYYNYDNFQNRYFWMEIRGDEKRRRFYFTPPKSLDEAALYGKGTILNEKEIIFRYLNVNIQLEGINRNIVLEIDRDWLFHRQE